ncbi:MAG: ABC transporter permease [Candidatus Methanomethylophilaceae archaeon]
MEGQHISNWRVISASSGVSVRNLFAVIPIWLWLAQALLTSLFSISFFALVAQYANNPDVTVAYVVIGNAVQSVALVSVYAVANIPSIEKHVGTLSALMVSPANLFSIFIGMAIFQVLAGFLTVGMSFAYAGLIFGVDLSMVSIPVLALTIIVTSLSMAGLGMMVGCMGLYLRSSMIMANIVTYMGLVLCGVNFPLSYLPEWLHPISYSLPLTYAVEATRMVTEGAGLEEISGLLMTMMTIGVLMFAISYVVFKSFEWIVRKTGKTDSF